MTYQAAIITQYIRARLGMMGIYLENQTVLSELIGKNIRRLNMGDKIAVDFNSNGIISAVKRIDGFDCLHTLGEGALIISYVELERYFNEQQSISVEFPE
jgi:hypothetical protein